MKQAVQLPRPATFVATTSTGPAALAGVTAVSEVALSMRTFVGVVDGSGLPGGITQSLDAKLNAAAAALGRGATVAATGQLGAFVNAVHAQTGKGIPTGQATFFTAVAQAILAALH